MKTNNQQETLPIEEGKPFNLTLAVGRVLIAGVIVLCVLYTAKAAFTDPALEALEKNYVTALNLYSKQRVQTIQALEIERNGADHACDSYKALKAYKEAKKIPLKNDGNPCVEFKAPQEGF